MDMFSATADKLSPALKAWTHCQGRLGAAIWLSFVIVVLLAALNWNRADVLTFFDQGQSDFFRLEAGAGQRADSISSGLVKDSLSGWQLRKDIAFRQRQLQEYNSDVGTGNVYFQNNWEPTFSCNYEMRLGRQGDGGKWVCNPSAVGAQLRPALVYSLGSNNDFSFEQAVNDFFHGKVEIHTFDFGIARNLPEFVNYHQWRLGANDADTLEGPPVRSLPTIFAELGHTGKTIDIFKIDIEGGEFDMLPSLLDSNLLKNIMQVQIEVHSWGKVANTLFRAFQNAGFEIFHKESNTIGCKGECIEYSFVRVDWEKLDMAAGLQRSTREEADKPGVQQTVQAI